MAEHLSTLDTMRADAIAHAAERIVTVLRAQGVGHVRALEFVDGEVTLTVGPGLAVSAEARGRQSRGSSDAALGWFAREVHLYNSAELGGTPVPFGFETPPPFEGAAKEAARSETQHAAWDEMRARGKHARADGAQTALMADVAERMAKHSAKIHGAF